MRAAAASCAGTFGRVGPPYRAAPEALALIWATFAKSLDDELQGLSRRSIGELAGIVALSKYFLRPVTLFPRAP
jgi:hypothetical protein